MIEDYASITGLRNVLAKFGQGAFYAYNDTTQTVTHNGGVTRLTMNTEVIDVNSWLASSVYTPKQPGYYLLFAQCTILNVDNDDFTNDRFDFYIRKNAATPTELSVTGTKRTSPCYCCILEANGSTDYFDVACQFTGTAGDTMKVSFTKFCGVFVSYNNP